MTIDITGRIGPLIPSRTDAEWPMFSYERPAYMVWNAIADNLSRRGWPDERIKDWLQSKNPRWALDGSLGDEILKLADQWATENI